MKRITFLLFVTIFPVLTSCNLDNDVNYHFEALEIKSIEMPESFDFGKVYNIKVNYLRPNDCTFFEGFDVRREDVTTRKVVAIGSVIEDNGAECKEIMQEVTASFNFEVVYDQPYLFKFWTGDDENGDPVYTEITVPVNTDTDKAPQL